ncbi:VOC family protein [Streptomyces sp. NPDC058301]|uniref:VOC family protein n=1 Tax=Streptomyces sp. NPDC058301 TaxID=3346436 RepID=UPI0036E77047
MSSAATQKLTVFLAFPQDAEEAVTFYTSLFDNSEVVNTIRARAGEPGWVEGTLQHAVFTLAGQQFMCINIPPDGARGSDHAPWDTYAFSPAMAVYVQCDSDDEFDRVFEGLSEKGEVIMPVGTYGFSAKFAWVNDRFGVSWRINLSESKVK